MDKNERTKKIEKLKEKRGKIIQDQRKMYDLAESEKREFTSDEETKYQKMETDFDTYTEEITTLVNEAEAERNKQIREQRLKERELELAKPEGRKTTIDPNNPDDKKKKTEREDIAKYELRDNFNDHHPTLIPQYREFTGERFSTQKYLDAFIRYLRMGDKTPMDVRDYLASEGRALQADLDTEGGFLVAPEQMVMQIIEAVDNMTFVRQYANVIPVPSAASLGAPARDNDVGDPEWTAEIRTGSEDDSLDFDKRDLHPHPLARRIKISKKLIRVSLIDIAAYVSKRLAYKIGIVQENNYLNGNGANRPLGVFVASSQGINTGRDVSTGNKTTEMQADGLIEAKYTLKKQYRQANSTRWAFHRDGIKQIRKLKDGEGQYIWKQGLSDKPDTILEIPFEESEYVPNTFTTGQYVGILGDWSTYWIADALNMEIQVLAELYAETNQNGYIIRYEGDGMPTIEEAWVRVKLA